ncbi:hypothetical protein SUGI_0395750 [Cryptomeria japonica]|nr:hypothetical protein SUGI_0395750 [Cryptomeria japonica]
MSAINAAGESTPPFSAHTIMWWAWKEGVGMAQTRGRHGNELLATFDQAAIGLLWEGFGEEFGTKEEVMLVVKACVPDHSLCGVTSLMARAVVGRGLRQHFGEGIMHVHDGVDAKFEPFLLWRDGANQEECTEEARLG